MIPHCGGMISYLPCCMGRHVHGSARPLSTPPPPLSLFLSLSLSLLFSLAFFLSFCLSRYPRLCFASRCSAAPGGVFGRFSRASWKVIPSIAGSEISVSVAPIEGVTHACFRGIFGVAGSAGKHYQDMGEDVPQQGLHQGKNSNLQPIDVHAHVIQVTVKYANNAISFCLRLTYSSMYSVQTIFEASDQHIKSVYVKQRLSAVHPFIC